MASTASQPIPHHSKIVSTFRYDEDVPILIPGINSEHAKLIDVQIKARGWKGFIIQIVQRNRLSISIRSTRKWIGEP